VIFVLVREALQTDLETLTELYRNFYVELRRRQGWVPRTLSEYVEEVRELLKRDKFFIAQDNNGEAVGFVRISCRDSSYWVEEIYVEPKRRGKGFGKALLERAEEYVKERDDALYVMVLPQDAKAMNFWLNEGYNTLNTIELVKYFSRVGGKTSLKKIEVLGYILNLLPWVEEEYGREEYEFLQALKEFVMAGGGREELLRALTKGLRLWLKLRE